MASRGRWARRGRSGGLHQISSRLRLGCGLGVEACPSRSLPLTNEYGVADDTRQDLIYTKADLLAPLLAGMEQPPHPMRLGDTEQDYYVQGPSLERRSGAVGEEHR